MLQYNSQRKKLIMPEYGRNIQQMVDYCCTIADREERTRCAYAIIKTMGNLFPQLRDEPDYKHKLWDHLAIMSDFKLDIDYPCEIVTEEKLETKPDAIPYHQEPMIMRHYGKIIERMIASASDYPEGEEKEALVMLIANQMKKSIYFITKEDVDDARIFRDMKFYSNGKLDVDPATHPLHEYKEAPAPQKTTPNKKKKKK